MTARDPDHRATRKPIETTAALPWARTFSRVGARIVLTMSSVSTRRATARTWAWTFATATTSKAPATKPIAPARPKINGGSDSTVKNAASAASPVTR